MKSAFEMDNGAFSWLMVQGPMAAAIGPIASLGGTLAGAGASIMGGEGQAAADKFQAAELEQEAQYGQLRATQTNSAMTRNLSNTLANIDAVRAARHDPASPTGAAVRGQTEFLGNVQKGVQVQNIMDQSYMDEQGAAYLRSAASSAMLGGDAGAGAGIFKGLMGAASSGAGLFGGGAGAGGFDMSDPNLRIFG